MVTSKTISSTTRMATALVIAVAIFVTALPCLEAQSPVSAPTYSPEGVPAAPGPSPDCATALFSLADCLSFVTAGSNLTVPDPACCPELAGLVDSQPICLCQLLGSGSAPGGIEIDNTKALQLPTACNVTTPPPSLCAVLGVPVSGPVSPSAGPSGGGLSPQGEVLAPASGNPGGGASSIGISGVSTLVCLAFGSFGAFLLV